MPADDLLAKAEKKMQQYLQADPDIIKNSKAKLRESWLSALNQHAENDLAQVEAIWWKPEVRMKMKMFIAYLTKGRK